MRSKVITVVELIIVLFIIVIVVKFWSYKKSYTQSSSPYIFISKWGSKGSKEGQFKVPKGIAIDSNDYIYVVDSSNHRIQKFDSSGNFITAWGRKGFVKTDKNKLDGLFCNPHGIAIDVNRNIYVADCNNSRIQKFDSDGKFLNKWGEYGTDNGQFLTPQGIAIDHTGYIYVTDSGTNYLQKFDINGKFIKKWVVKYEKIVNTQPLRGIAIDSSGCIYISNSIGAASYDPGIVKKFDSFGKLLSRWGVYGGKEYFYGLNGIAINSKDYIFVSEGWKNRIQVFNTDGIFITEWGSYGSCNGYFKGPEDIALDSKGNVYVVDCWNHRIQKFKSNPKFKLQ